MAEQRQEGPEWRIAIVGAGIVGLSAAVCIKNSFTSSEVVLLADQFSPNTTADNAAAMVSPPKVGFAVDANPSSVRWFNESYDHFRRIGCSPDAVEAGVMLAFGYTLDRSPGPWFYQDTVLGWRLVAEEERQLMNLPDLKTWMFYGTFVVNCRQHLPWLMRQFTDKGGVVVRRKIASLQGLLSEFDIVVNCSGLGARELTQDTSLQPAWGQGRLVEAPWIKYFVVADVGTLSTEQLQPNDRCSNEYEVISSLQIIPRADGVYVGGVKVRGKGEGPVEPHYRAVVRQVTEAVMPSLSGASVLKEWTGVRPMRRSVRLCVEEFTQDSGIRKCVIHNYGHSGSGVTLSWGCALEVTSLVKDILLTCATVKD